MNQREKDNEVTVLRNRGTKVVQAPTRVIQPRAVENLNRPGELVFAPDEVKSQYVKYVKDVLYARDTIVTQHKPWMTNDAVSFDFKARCSEKPMVWPLAYSRAGWMSMIKNGNRKPSPGPDGVEKWYHQHLSERANDISRSITNHVIMNNYWGESGDLKAVTMLGLYKKGIFSNLSNYRFLWLTNFHAAAATSQFARCLQDYSVSMSLLPLYQIATRPGTQTRDLTSFIEHLQTWVRRSSTQKLYACKRDDMKGFDNQIPEAFEDAVDFFGLDPSVKSFDRESNSSVSCQIRTAFGLTGKFTLSGVNRQGGAPSPIKFNLKAAMGYHWLAFHKDVLDTPKVRSVSDHTATSRSSYVVPYQLWAMDDSLLLSQSIAGLQEGVRIQELFNIAYGGKTNWAHGKSCAYAFHLGESASSIDFASHDGIHTLVLQNNIDFLKTPIGRPSIRVSEIRGIIDDIKFPLKHNGWRYTLALVRMWINVLIMPKIRAKLRTQPIPDKLAYQLDTLLLTLVRNYMHWYYNPARCIMFRTIDHGGFGFQSIQSINRAIIVSGVLRDLNHHMPSYRNMARITYNDWSCLACRCANPFDLSSNAPVDAKFGPLPFSWTECRSMFRSFSRCDVRKRESDGYVGCSKERCREVCMYNMKSMQHLFLQNNRIDELLSGSITVSHLLNISSSVRERSPMEHSLMMGKFKINSLLAAMVNSVFDRVDGCLSISAAMRSRIQEYHEPERAAVLAQLDLVVAYAGPWGKVSNLEPLIPDIASQLDKLQAALLDSGTNMRINDEALIGGTGIVATDGSKYMDCDVVSGAVVGYIELGLQFTGPEVKWSTQGELLSMLVALMIIRQLRSLGHVRQFLFITDYEPLVNKMNFGQIPIPDYKISLLADSGIYRAILLLWREMKAYSSVRHVKAHTQNQDLLSLWNGKADDLAKRAQSDASIVMKYPRFTQDDFDFRGLDNSRAYAAILKISSEDLARDMVLRTIDQRVLVLIYGQQYYPRYRYRFSPVDWATSIQPLIRAKVLNTNVRRYRSEGKLPVAARNFSPWCDCGIGIEDEHHIFVECKLYDSQRERLRSILSSRLLTQWDKWVVRDESPDRVVTGLDEARELLLSIPEWIFSDAQHWPGGSSFFFAGLVPAIEVDLCRLGVASFPCRIFKEEVHNACVNLVGLIWSARGKRYKEMAIGRGEETYWRIGGASSGEVGR